MCIRDRPGTTDENKKYDGSHPHEENTQQLEGKVTGHDVDAGHKLWFGVVAGDQRKEGNEGWEGATPPATDDFLADESTVEGGDSKTVPGTFGSLTLNSDGTWTYTLKGEQEMCIRDRCKALQRERRRKMKDMKLWEKRRKTQ